MRNTLAALEKLGVTHLLTIGGDDTAFSAMNLAQEAGSKVRVVSVPKTIDNDLPLPGNMTTFGYETARHVGVYVLKNLMEDATTTGRWYLAVTMGRKAGHLALGIGKAAGATLTLIAEEFNSGPISLDHVTDVLETSIVKRRALGRRDGVVVLAEGILERMEEEQLKRIGEIEQDEFGHLRLAELDLGKLLKNEVKKRFSARGEKIQIVDKEIGYELRCAPPIPADAEYVCDLGFGAVRFLLRGGTGALLTVVQGRAVPIYLTELVDPKTDRIRVRYVDVNTEGYEVARQYMTRLEKRDLEDAELLERMAAEVQLSPEQFVERFAYLTE
jgi:6-phosphofructokinase 1